MFPPFLLISVLVLAGLVFVMFIGRRRQTPQGDVDAPAPLSPESPLMGEPKRKPANRQPR